MRAFALVLVAFAALAALAFSRRAAAAGEGVRIVIQEGKPLPRGIRNHNPGNLRPGSDWRGLADPSVDEANYLIFTAPHWGIRAMTINLLNQQRRHGLRTLRTIFTKYAPPSENDTGAYVRAMSRALGVGSDDTLDLVSNADQLGKLVRAVIRHENGVQPYTDAQLEAAIAEARST